MRVHSFLAGAIALLALAACARNDETKSAAPDAPEAARAELYRELELESPRPGALVDSPIHIFGRAIGPWYAEGAFTAKLLATDGTLLAEGPVETAGDWMSVEFAPFEAHLPFEKGRYDGGTLVLENANPSGNMESARTLRVDVRF